jgi:hypothetical protein
MAQKSLAEIRAWIAASSMVRFQKELDAETEETRYDILAGLLADEYEKFVKEPLPGVLRAPGGTIPQTGR